MVTEKKPKNELVDDLIFAENANGGYGLKIEGDIKEGVVRRLQDCYSERNVKGKNTISGASTTGSTTSTEKNGLKSGNIDYVSFKPGGHASYQLVVNGQLKGARIARIHRCNDC